MPLRVLVVDDEDDICWTLRQTIEAAGHCCVVAKTGREALQAVGRETLHLAFVDVRLPDLDGFDLVRRIRVLAPRLPCVLVSGFVYEDDDSVREGLDSGLIAGFIGKPFLLTQIQEVLETVATATGSGREAGHVVDGGKPIPFDGIPTPRDALCTASAGAVPDEQEKPKRVRPLDLE